jgi:hypothetical protein
MNREIQTYPSVDNLATDAFESIVETFYQLNGYITSSNKWFWYNDERNDKKQQGYQDIDVLAINSNSVKIVSVTSNLDDKIRFKSNGLLNDEMLDKLIFYFKKCEDYLNCVDEYKWIINKDVEKNNRTVDYVIAYSLPNNKLHDKISSVVDSDKIKLLSPNEISNGLEKYVVNNDKFISKNNGGLNARNNQLIRFLQLQSRVHT